MPKYVAFLRAINVGGHIVKMDHLRSLFESLGFSNVETFIASGNVIFDSASKNTKALEKKIAGCLQEIFGYQVATFVRSLAELKEVARNQPFPAAEPKTVNTAKPVPAVLYIAFLAETPDVETKKKLLSFSTEIDLLHLSEREVYWLSRKNLSESKFSAALIEKTLKMKATLRNSNTIQRITAKYP
jgi:uncharacterized protein (DUF1697 family)